MFVIFSGVSGAGKNTIINELLTTAGNRFLIKSATTREKRSPQLDINYDFFTDEEFEKKRRQGDFFEVNEVHQFKYATQNSELKKIINNPQNIYMKDIDVEGAQKLVEYLKGKAEVLTIFLDVPDDELYARLIARGESDERAKLRISRGEFERKFKSKYDLVIDNTNLKHTLEVIEKEIKNRA